MLCAVILIFFPPVIEHSVTWVKFNENIWIGMQSTAFGMSTDFHLYPNSITFMKPVFFTNINHFIFLFSTTFYKMLMAKYNKAVKFFLQHRPVIKMAVLDKVSGWRALGSSPYHGSNRLFGSQEKIQNVANKRQLKRPNVWCV